MSVLRIVISATPRLSMLIVWHRMMMMNNERISFPPGDSSVSLHGVDGDGVDGDGDGRWQ